MVDVSQSPEFCPGVHSSLPYHTVWAVDECLLFGPGKRLLRKLDSIQLSGLTLGIKWLDLQACKYKGLAALSEGGLK